MLGFAEQAVGGTAQGAEESLRCPREGSLGLDDRTALGGGELLVASFTPSASIYLGSSAGWAWGHNVNKEAWSPFSENPVPSEFYRRLDHLTLGGRVPALQGEQDRVSPEVPSSLEVS